MKNEYNDAEARALLGVDETTLKLLRVSVLDSARGKLNDNNISAMRSYLENSPPKRKRGRPVKSISTQKKHSNAERGNERDAEREGMFIPLERVKELVLEAHQIGYEEARKNFKVCKVDIKELLEQVPP